MCPSRETPDEPPNYGGSSKICQESQAIHKMAPPGFSVEIDKEHALHSSGPDVGQKTQSGTNVLVVDVTQDLRALGPSGIMSCRSESDDEVLFLTITAPDGTLIEVPIACGSRAGRTGR